jgi:hypothetical protein
MRVAAAKCDAGIWRKQKSAIVLNFAAVIF